MCIFVWLLSEAGVQVYPNPTVGPADSHTFRKIASFLTLSENILPRGPCTFGKSNNLLITQVFRRRPVLRRFRTVPKAMDFPLYHIKCSAENAEYFTYVVSSFPLHFMLFRENLDCFS